MEPRYTKKNLLSLAVTARLLCLASIALLDSLPLLHCQLAP